MIGHFGFSITGSSHLKSAINCQDSNGTLLLDNGWIISVVADGIGSCAKSDQGSKIAVDTILKFVSENIPDMWHDESMISLLRVAYHKALHNINTTAKENGDSPSEYDTTLTSVIYNGRTLVFAHVGDGGLITLSSYGEYSILTERQKGDTWNSTYVLSSGPDIWTFGASVDDVCAFTLMTDGLFDIAADPGLEVLEDCNNVYVSFMRPILDRNIQKYDGQDDFVSAGEHFQKWVDSSCRNSTSDDMTLVCVINTDVLPDVMPDDYYAEPDWLKIRRIKEERLYGEVYTEDTPEDTPED